MLPVFLLGPFRQHPLSFIKLNPKTKMLWSEVKALDLGQPEDTVGHRGPAALRGQRQRCGIRMAGFEVKGKWENRVDVFR